jgi:hypothetical protein
MSAGFPAALPRPERLAALGRRGSSIGDLNDGLSGAMNRT